MAALSVRLFLSLAAFCNVAFSQRFRIKFDFGWLFHLGQNGLFPNCTDADFPINMAGVQCLGLSQVAASNISECRDACCGDMNCGTYQWCPPSQPKGCSPASSCWIGAMNDCHNGTGWQSMGRPTPAPPQGPIQPDYDDSDWTEKNVPHDYIVETGAFNPNNDRTHGYLPKNISWYRKHFTLDSHFKGKSIWIDFDGVYRDSDMWLNGNYLGNHQSGYTSFRWYIDQMPLNFGPDADNVLVVRVNPTQNEGWWYEGGGIYRHVWLNVADQVHIKPWGVYAGNNVTSISSDRRFGTAMANIQTNLTYNTSSGSSMTVSLQTDIVSMTTGQMIATDLHSGISLVPGKEVLITQNFASLQNIRLWSIANPELYTVYSSLIDSNGNVIDSVSTRFGFRRTYFDVDGGLYLNDEYVKMTGFCNHQDFAGCGVAMPDRVNRFRVEHLQEMGANSWRMSHNPPNPELLDFTDEYGMLVWDENRNFANNTQYLQDQQDMINRDKNHPSIIIWSLCNEGGCMEGDANGGNVGKMFESVIRRIDNVNTRPISAAMNADWGDALSTVLDIQGINYNYNQYDAYHAAHPSQPIISSESCSCTTDRGQYSGDNATTGHVSAYSSCVWECWQPVVERKFIIGSFDWTGFDYKGEPTPYAWPCINSHFGVNDIAGFAKDDYWYYRAWWQQGNETIVHVLPDDWDQWSVNQKVSVWIYSNADYVDLQLNGNSVSNGMQQIAPQSPLQLSVTYQAGNLTAIAYDANKNQVSAHSVETTTKQPYAVQLVITYPGTTIYSDGQDIALIEARIVDNMGRRIPDAANMLNFTVVGDGVIYGVGNGDPSCHEPDKASYRSAFHGRARVIVQSILNQPGDMRLTAISEGLISDTITIYTVPNEEGKSLLL